METGILLMDVKYSAQDASVNILFVVWSDSTLLSFKATTEPLEKGIQFPVSALKNKLHLSEETKVFSPKKGEKVMINKGYEIKT